jgi:hypothetical protein
LNRLELFQNFSFWNTLITPGSAVGGKPFGVFLNIFMEARK